MVRNNFNEGEKRHQEPDSCYLSLFSWLTTLLVAIARPLMLLLLALTLGPCLLKCILHCVKPRVNSTELLVLRCYNSLPQDEPVI